MNKNLLRSVVTAAALWAASMLPALAQTSPNWTYGYVPTPAQWNATFAGKQDTLGYTPLNLAGGNMTGRLVTAAPGATTASFNLTPGSAPASPVNGDMWATSGGLYVRINGVTIGPLSGATSTSFAATAPLAVSFPAGVTTYALNVDSTLTAGSSLTINLSNANTWLATQTFPNNSLTLAEFPTIGANTAIGSIAGGTPAALSKTQITTLVNLATASLSGALPAWPNNTTTFFRGDGTYATLNFTAVAGILTSAAGGTGINNGSSTITLGGSIVTAAALTQAGAFATTITSTAITNSTLPAGTHTLAGLDVAQTWSALQQYNSSNFRLNGSGSGSLVVNCAATCGTNTLTLPGGTTDFSATGGSNQFVKQSSTGAALTVAAILAADLPVATNAAFGAVKPDTTTITISAGIITAVGGVATSLQPGTTTVTGGTIGQCLGKGPSGNLLNQIACADLTLAGQVLSGGATVTSNNLGTKSSGTTTVDCGLSPLQYLLNGGAFTLAAPANDGSCFIQVVNGGSAGTITLSGFSPQPTGFGDTFATANTASGTATFSNGSANITYTSTLGVGNQIYFTTSGGLPTNFAINTNYYVVSNSGTVLTVAATPGGSAIVAGSAGSGTQTAHVPSVFDISIARINGSAIALWKQVQ